MWFSFVVVGISAVSAFGPSVVQPANRSAGLLDERVKRPRGVPAETGIVDVPVGLDDLDR
jgi:hypothetical protein